MKVPINPVSELMEFCQLKFPKIDFQFVKTMKKDFKKIEFLLGNEVVAFEKIDFSKDELKEETIEISFHKMKLDLSMNSLSILKEKLNQ